MKELCTTLGIKQRLHCPYHPQSPGLAKLCAETGLKWVLLSPLALMSMRSTPTRKHKLTPHEIITGRPMIIPSNSIFCMKKIGPSSMDETMMAFCSSLTSAVQRIYRQVKASQSLPGNQPCRDIQPGVWVCIREYQRKNGLKSCWSTTHTSHHQHRSKVRGPTRVDTYVLLQEDTTTAMHQKPTTEFLFTLWVFFHTTIYALETSEHPLLTPSAWKDNAGPGDPEADDQPPQPP